MSNAFIDKKGKQPAINPYRRGRQSPRKFGGNRVMDLIDFGVGYRVIGAEFEEFRKKANKRNKK